MTLSGLNSKVLKNGDPEPDAPKPGTFRIYSMRFCPWAQRALIYAAKKQIPTEVVNIHLKDKPSWYFSKHYKGQVPALEHDGKYIIESAIIPEYLDEILPNNRILPSDPYQKVLQKLLLERLGALAPKVHAVANSPIDPKIHQERIADLIKTMEDCEALLDGQFYSGNSPGFVDYLFFPNIERVYWLSRTIFLDITLDSSHFPGGSKFPKLTRWFSEMTALPEIEQTRQSVDDGIAFMKGVFEGKPNYDYGL